jgi:predicted Zn-dependent protease
MTTASGYSPQETVERALAAARSDDCVVIAEETSSANLRWAGNTLTTNGVSASRQLTVIAINRHGHGPKDASAGVVSRAGVRPDQIEDVVRAAERAAAEGTPAEDAEKLAGPDQPGSFGMRNEETGGTGGRDQAGSFGLKNRDEPGWESPPERTEIGVLRDFAVTLGETLRAAKAGGRKLYGFAEHELTSTFLGTSTGVRQRHDQPAGRVELNAKSADLERSAWAGVATRDFTDVDVGGLDAGLAERLDWAKRTISLPAGRYETLLPPTAVSDLLIYLYWSAGAKEAAEGRTVFSKAGGGTRIGERLSAQPVTLSSDPRAPGLACAPFVLSHASGPDSSVFDNGLPLSATSWISDGSLAALISSRHSADVAGLPVTPAIGNLTFATSAPAAPTLPEMIASTGRALLLTCLWYIREVDPQTLLLTGLTRDGVYLVEDGEVVGAVNNFRFNESPVGMLERLLEVGATVPTLPREWGDYFNRAAMPPIRVEGFNMSSVSQAS